MRHLESFGKLDLYLETISLVKYNRHLWRKVANILNNLRHDLRVLEWTPKENQVKCAKEYLSKSLVDTKMPDEVRTALKTGINREFGFTFEE